MVAYDVQLWIIRVLSCDRPGRQNWTNLLVELWLSYHNIQIDKGTRNHLLVTWCLVMILSHNAQQIVEPHQTNQHMKSRFGFFENGKLTMWNWPSVFPNIRVSSPDMVDVNMFVKIASKLKCLRSDTSESSLFWTGYTLTEHLSQNVGHCLRVGLGLAWQCFASFVNALLRSATAHWWFHTHYGVLAK